MSLSWLNDWEQGVQHRYIEDFVRRQIENQSGRILDLCCGTMPHRGLAARAHEWVGLDWPAPGSPAKPDVVASAMRLPFRSESFDCVLATEALEHLPDPAKALAEVRRVMKPQAVLVLTVPFMAGLHEEPRDFFRYTPYALRHLCAEAGLGVEEVRSFGTVFSATACMLLRHSGPVGRALGPARGLFLWFLNGMIRLADRLALRSGKRFDASPLGFGLVARAV